MIDLPILLEAERRVRVDRDGGVREVLVDALSRHDRGPAPCCPLPCCTCCWEAV